MSSKFTKFDQAGFTCGAFGGACLLASALGAALQAASQRNGRAWASWNREQLEAGLTLSEALRARDHARAEAAEDALRKSKILDLKKARAARASA